MDVPQVLDLCTLVREDKYLARIPLFAGAVVVLPLLAVLEWESG